MNEYQKRVLDARKKFLKLTLEQEKELLSIYEEAGKQVSERLSKAKEGSLNQRYLSELNKSIKEYVSELRLKLGKSIKDGMMASAEIAANAQAAYFDGMGLNEDLNSSFRKMFSQLPIDVVKTLINGNYYADGKTLDQRIWNLTSKNAKDIDRLIKVNVAQMRDVREVAKQLDAYVNPNSKTKAKTKIPGMKSNVSYQAQRLARTSLDHANTEAYIQGSKKNPFCKGLKWNLSSSHYERQVKRHGPDICDKYAKEDAYKLGDGVFPSDKYPISHPNCLCYCTTVTVDIEDAREELIAWVKGENNPKLDKWLDDYGEEFGIEGSHIEKFNAFSELAVLNASKDNVIKEKKILFKPAKTIEEAERYSKKVIGIDADFKDMDLELANGINQRTERVLKVIPELKEVFHKQIATDKLMSGNVWADSDSEIRYNLKYYKNYKHLNALYKNSLNQGFHPVGTDVHSTATHELGHNLDSLLTNHGYGTPKKNSVFDNEASYTIKKNVLKKLGLKASDVQKELSGYATKNPEEFLAEAIAEYFDSPNPRPIAMATWEEVEKLLKDMRSKVDGNIVKEGVNQAKKHDKKIEVTNIAIDKVRPAKLQGFTDKQNAILQQKHKELLKIAKGKNNSNEVLNIVTTKFEKEVITLGSENGVNPGNNPEAVSIMRNSQDNSVIWIHNHPKGSTFSYTDIGQLIKPQIKAITIVTNSGKVFALNKKDSFDLIAFYDNIKSIKAKYGGKLTNENEGLITNEILKTIEQYGVQYVK